MAELSAIVTGSFSTKVFAKLTVTLAVGVPSVVITPSSPSMPPAFSSLMLLESASSASVPSSELSTALLSSPCGTPDASSSLFVSSVKTVSMAVPPSSYVASCANDWNGQRLITIASARSRLVTRFAILSLICPHTPYISIFLFYIKLPCGRTKCKWLTHVVALDAEQGKQRLEDHVVDGRDAALVVWVLSA